MLLGSSFLLFCMIYCCQSGLGIGQQLNQNGLRILEQQTCGIFTRIKVINGHEVKLGSRPWMALLLLRSDTEEKFACGGTLISERFILTAAHCLSRYQLVSVRLGEHKISTDSDCKSTGSIIKCSPPVEDINVERIFLHEDYSRFTGHNDIALIKLARAVEYKQHIKPICLPINEELQQQTDSQENFIVTGWGITENGTASDVLMETMIQMRNRQACSRYFVREIIETQLCVGDLVSDSCRGDSGGPLLYPAEYLTKQRFVQFGIVSYGAISCGNGYPGVYTKVSSFMPWITNILGTSS
ncbi:serine protease grass-like [Drosophila innubila]|uniref:serine protease grass-like n=1 Tax=Drosophila innubila TaxID=198719 RepID=UPI00148B8A8C|nr:serine protease grass-like [Drosophila innubila]